jgi:hypothetical protein
VRVPNPPEDLSEHIVQFARMVQNLPPGEDVLTLLRDDNLLSIGKLTPCLLPPLVWV